MGKIHKFIIFLGLLVSISSFAEYQLGGKELVKKTLQSVNSVDNTNSIFTKIYTDFNSNGICPSDIKCLKKQLSKINKKLRKEKVIDDITFKIIKKVIPNILLKNNVLIINPKLLKTSKYTNLSEYLSRKLYYAKRRKFKNNIEKLNPNTLKTLNLYYPKKVKGMGKVSVEEYVYLKYSKTAVTKIEEAMEKAYKYLLSMSGRLILAHSDYQLKLDEQDRLYVERSKLNKLLYMADVDETINAEELEAKLEDYTKKIVEIGESLTVLKLEESLRNSRKDREQKYDEYLKLTEDDFEEKELLLEEIMDLDESIASYKRKISEHYTPEVIPLADLKRFVYSFINVRILPELNKSKHLKNTPVKIGDLIAVSYVSGKYNNKRIDELLLDKETHKNYVPKWKKALNLLETMGRSLLMLNPTTAPYALIGFTIYDSLTTIYKSKLDRQNDSHLIPSN